MSEQANAELTCGEDSRGGLWFPLRKWWHLSQDVGLPPFLEPGNPVWMNVNWLQRSLAAFSWPLYIPAPLFVPYICGSMHHPSQKISKEQYKWRVNLDVAHFAPAEISLSVRDGFLEIAGKHEERPDEHGFIARCFTRKYRLPAETDASKISSTLTVDGILTVEASVPEASVPAAIIIPIKVEMEADGKEEKHEKEETPETDPGSSAPVASGSPSVEDHGEESPLEVHGDQAHPGSATAGIQQHEERREQEEETNDKPDRESHPVSANGEGSESLHDSSVHHEGLKSQESPHTDTSTEPEHKEAAVGEEIQQVVGDSGGAAEEISQPEELELGKSPPNGVLSQVLEDPDIKQEHAE
uniref:SHSP domain-containing protein n=1 Tax=Monopterus albus TaxID=43700 RepID=A0A3Q3IN59_MONAL